MAYQSLSREDRAARFAAVALLHVGFAAIFVSLGGVGVIREQFKPLVAIFVPEEVIPVAPKPPEPVQTTEAVPTDVPEPIYTVVKPAASDDSRVIKTATQPTGNTGTQTTIVPKDPDPVALPEPIRRAASFDPRFADRIQPPYPGLARSLGEEGRVTLLVRIGIDGRVTDVLLRDSSGSTTLDEAAMRYARKYWRFKPATVDGVAVATEVVKTILFKLDSAKG
jgi:periplasmic protein TonB